MTTLLLAVLLAAPVGDEHPVDWSELTRCIERTLERRDAREWAAEVAAEPMPDDLSGLLLRLLVLGRGGRSGEIEPVIDALERVRDNRSMPWISLACGYIVDLGEFQLSKAVLERLGYPAASLREFLREFQERTDTETVDAWLSARAREDPRYLAAGERDARALLDHQARWTLVGCLRRLDRIEEACRYFDELQENCPPEIDPVPDAYRPRPGY